MCKTNPGNCASDKIANEMKDLIWPFGIEHFLEIYWRKSAFYQSGTEESMGGLLKDPRDIDIEELLHQTPDDVSVWSVSASGALKSTMMEPKNALNAYSLGATLNIDLCQKQPQARHCVDAIGRPLGIPPGAGFCNLICVKSPHITPAHFDPNENFTIQLRGSKTWRLWTECRVEAPLHNRIVGRRAHDELELYLGGIREPDLGSADLEVVLDPGSALYVPRGAWHEVQTLGDSISLNFLYPAMPRVDLFLPLLRRYLIRHPFWRHDAYDVAAEEDATARTQKIEEMVSKFAADFAHFSPRFITGDVSFDPSGSFFRNPIATFKAETRPDGLIDVEIVPGKARNRCTFTSSEIQFFYQIPSDAEFYLSDENITKLGLGKYKVLSLARHAFGNGLLLQGGFFQ